MDGFLIIYPKIFNVTRLAYHTRQYQSDDVEKTGNPHNLSIRFEGLDRLRTLKGLQYHIRQHKNDDTKRLVGPHDMSNDFEGLHELRSLRVLCTI
jgi:hypothetical protein